MYLTSPHTLPQRRKPKKKLSSPSSAATAENNGVQLELTAFFKTREQLGIQIATSGNSIIQITKNHYKVKSQSNESQDVWYHVKKLDGVNYWSCECPDFVFMLTKGLKDKKCKHIIAVQTLQKTYQTESKIEKAERPKICPRCLSSDMAKNGFRVVKNGIRRQRYSCRDCNFKFILGEMGFSNVSSNPEMIVEALSLILGGMSYRNAARHLASIHQQKFNHVTLMHWFRKYIALIKVYIDKKFPEYEDVWSVDETMINVKNTKPTGKGFYSWMWTVIQPKTRFVIASEVSKKREVSDARAILKSAKEKVEAGPLFVITDSLYSYESAFRKEFDRRRAAHVKTKSIADGFANRPIERYHNEVRETLKNMRGLGNDKSAQTFADAQRINHNFIRPHSGLPDNITPTEVAGLDLKLGDNKIKDLIGKSAEAREEAKREYNIEIQLGKRAEYLKITYEKDCISVKPKIWLAKQLWKEIHDILRINKFNWLENGKQSQWIKMREV